MLAINYREHKDKELRVLDELWKDTWIHAENPSDREIAYLVNNFGIEESLLRDALDIHEVPRIETSNGSVYVFTRFPYQVDEHLDTAPLLIVIQKQYIITISPIRVPLLETFTSRNLFATSEREKIMLATLEEVALSYGTYLNSTSRIIRRATVRLEKIDNKDIIQFVVYESVLNDFLLSLIKTNLLLSKLSTIKGVHFTKKDGEGIQDLAINMDQLIEITKENLRNIVNVREASSTIITNNLNRVIKLFTSLTVILTIPMIITSVYGMNINLPFADSPYAFIYIISATFFFVFLLILVFLGKRWL